MKAIQTVYHGPTDTRGSRIIASCDGGRIIMGYQHELNSEGNHREAAQKLCIKMGWCRGDFSDLHTGFLVNGTYAHVLSR